MSILLSILVSIKLANIDNSTLFVIFMHLSANCSWVCKLPFLYRGISWGVYYCPWLYVYVCASVFFPMCWVLSKKRQHHCSVTVSSKSLRWQTFKLFYLEWFVLNPSRVLRVGNMQIFFLSPDFALQSGLHPRFARTVLCKKCWRIIA
jgi:hypothetical protein